MKLFDMDERTGLFDFNVVEERLEQGFNSIEEFKERSISRQDVLRLCCIVAL